MRAGPEAEVYGAYTLTRFCSMKNTCSRVYICGRPWRSSVARGIEGQKLTRGLYTTLQVGVDGYTQRAVEIVVRHRCEDVP
jgi:hypothetical protein